MGKYPSTLSRTPQRVELLAVSGCSRDRLSLESILIHTNWLVHWVADGYEAMLFLRDHPVPVFVCPEELPDTTWRDLVGATQELASPPKILVFADRADQSLGAEVLDAGGYQLLATPLQRDEVLRAISLACRTWREEIRRQEVHAAAMTA